VRLCGLHSCLRFFRFPGDAGQAAR
jgi:hypothetical protein